jgi:hypothetical protein
MLKTMNIRPSHTARLLGSVTCIKGRIARAKIRQSHVPLEVKKPNSAAQTGQLWFQEEKTKSLVRATATSSWLALGPAGGAASSVQDHFIVLLRIS